MGYQLSLEQTCPQCGYPLSVCRDPSMSGRFTIQEGTCYATEVRDLHQQEQQKNGGSRPGQVLYTIAEEPADPQESAIAHTLPDWMKPG